jgi:hypothetical protein
MACGPARGNGDAVTDATYRWRCGCPGTALVCLRHDMEGPLSAQEGDSASVVEQESLGAQPRAPAKLSISSEDDSHLRAGDDKGRQAETLSGSWDLVSEPGTRETLSGSWNLADACTAHAPAGAPTETPLCAPRPSGDAGTEATGAGIPHSPGETPPNSTAYQFVGRRLDPPELAPHAAAMRANRP